MANRTSKRVSRESLWFDCINWPLTSREANFSWKCLRWLSPKVVSVPTSVTGALRGSTATCDLVVCVCHRGHCKALSRCRRVGSCVLLGEISSGLKPRLHTWQSQATSQWIVFSSLSDQWEIRTSFTIFFHFFESVFCCFLYHGDQ